ncbi:Lipid-A-disaccharide synthase [Rhodospirillaceae bacterium LM-1]|nr:Lipid-A-disaccharide synthase [Rhodospirillaceae bacterium LM-1]
MTQPLRFFLIAGEPSGDFLASRLMSALRGATDAQVSFEGVGGENMASQGLQSLFPIADLSVMGLVEVLPRLPLILKRLDQTMSAIERFQPHAVITVDSWGFTGRVARALHKRGSRIPRIHYVAPMVWAWKENRAKGVARYVNRLLALFPHELPYFQRHGLDTVCVGHPVIESGAGAGDAVAFRERHGIGRDVPLLAVLPGSRMGEVKRLLPVFERAAARIAAKHPGLMALVPTVDTVAGLVASATANWSVPTFVLRGMQEKYDAFAAARAAMAASGTVALELAMARLPHVVAYKLNPITVMAARRLFKIPYVNLSNILLERLAVPELIQEDCTPERLSDEVLALMADGERRQRQIEDLDEAMRRLGQGGASPSQRAAQAVLEMIKP